MTASFAMMAFKPTPITGDSPVFIRKRLFGERMDNSVCLAILALGKSTSAMTEYISGQCRSENLSSIRHLITPRLFTEIAGEVYGYDTTMLVCDCSQLVSGC